MTNQEAIKALTQKELDIISRQAAIDVVRKCRVIEVTPAYILIDKGEVVSKLVMLPPTQLEPSIPISWIEKQIDWLKSTGNRFSIITAMHLSVLVKKWRKEMEK